MDHENTLEESEGEPDVLTPPPKRQRSSDALPEIHLQPLSQGDAAAPLTPPADAAGLARAPPRSPLSGRCSWSSAQCSPSQRARLRANKSVHDRVHDLISLPRALVAVIDTPEFQRLRSLKQLGCCQYLFPGATHTRFEHSIGVAHLAGSMVRHLRIARPDLVTERDVLCVMLAGLAHDLGHGPFSHMFELFVNQVREQAAADAAQQGSQPPPPVVRWHHESASAAMLRHLITANDINLASYDLHDADLEFVLHLIAGLKPGAPWPTNIGRTEDKRFLFDIVANKRNGIDVDKLDYFIRDSVNCYGKMPFDCPTSRIISCSHIAEADGETQICFEEKLALTLCDIFALRARLHKYVYQHHVVKICDQMILDVLMEADPYFRVSGSGGQPLRLSETVNDMVGYSRVGDWVLDAIEAASDPQLRPAQDILQRFRRRDLYPLLGIIPLDDARHSAVSEGDIHAEVLGVLRGTYGPIDPSVLVVINASITYGSSDSEGKPDNPVHHVRFVNPKTAEEGCGRPHHLDPGRICPLFLPQTYCQRQVVVCTRLADRADEAFRPLLDAFTQTRNRYLRRD